MTDFLESLRSTFGTEPFTARDVVQEVSRGNMPDMLRFRLRQGESPTLSVGRWLASQEGIVLVAQNGKHGRIYKVQP